MREQTFIEERYNYVTHAIGFVLAIVAFVLLLFTTRIDTYTGVFSLSLYGLSLCVLYFISSKYHYLTNQKKKRYYRKLDHISIYMLIAGTYTPVSLIFLSESKGMLLFYIVWSIALLGTVLKIFFTGKFEVISLVLYLVMGWLIVIDFSALKEVVSSQSLNFLFAGGAAYTGGIIFYVWEKLKYNHVVWHLFVLAGSIFHFLCIYLELI